MIRREAPYVDCHIGELADLASSNESQRHVELEHASRRSPTSTPGLRRRSIAGIIRAESVDSFKDAVAHGATSSKLRRRDDVERVDDFHQRRLRVEGLPVRNGHRLHRRRAESVFSDRSGSAAEGVLAYSFERNRSEKSSVPHRRRSPGGNHFRNESAPACSTSRPTTSCSTTALGSRQRRRSRHHCPIQDRIRARRRIRSASLALTEAARMVQQRP